MNNWFYPENFKESERKHREKNINPDVKNDFGSYKVLLKTGNIKESMISAHNDINPKGKLKVLKKIIHKFLKIKKINSILNVGCGTGFETKGLSEIYNSYTTGIEASLDGIAYAKKYNSNKKTKFIGKTIDNNFLLDTKFDICFAIEFYPFTRTTDLEFQKSIISAIFKNLKKGGSLIIYQLDVDFDSLNNNITELSSLLNKNIKVISNFHPKIFKFLPNLTLTKFVCLTLEKLSKRTLGKIIIIIN